MSAGSIEARRGCQIPLSWTYKWLLDTLCYPSRINLSGSSLEHYSRTTATASFSHPRFLWIPYTITSWRALPHSQLCSSPQLIQKPPAQPQATPSRRPSCLPTDLCFLWSHRPPPPTSLSWCFPTFQPPSPTRIPHEHTSRAGQQNRQNTSTTLKIQIWKRNQGTKYSPNKNKPWNQHWDLESPQTQIPKCQHKNTINNSQNNMSLLEHSCAITAGYEYSNIANTYVKMIEVLKDEMNKSLTAKKNK